MRRGGCDGKERADFIITGVNMEAKKKPVDRKRLKKLERK